MHSESHKADQAEESEGMLPMFVWSEGGHADHDDVQVQVLPVIPDVWCRPQVGTTRALTRSLTALQVAATRNWRVLDGPSLRGTLCTYATVDRR